MVLQCQNQSISHFYQQQIPPEGFHSLAQQTETEILVYQAFNHQIADFAIKNQRWYV